MDAKLKQFIAGLPKAELHLHLEGSLEPEQMFMFAQRNNVEIPFKSVEEVKQAYQFTQLQDFLDIYYQGMGVLLKEQDFYDLTTNYLENVAKDNTQHVEVFFDPQGHTERGVPFETAITGIYNALVTEGKRLGITFKLIMSYLRHLSEESAFKTLEKAMPFKHMIDGVGLDSSELGNPPSKFKNVFDKSREAGFKLVAHAGEEGPAEYVYEALDLLKIDRIDHGNRSMDDEALIKRIADMQIALTVCPLSNLKLCVIDDMKKHPIQQMIDHNMLATINSDDPAYFGGYMNDNFWAVAEGLDLNQEQMIKFAKNGFIGSFLEQSEIDAYLAKIDTYVAEFNAVN